MDMDNERGHCWVPEEVEKLRRLYVPGATNVLLAQNMGIPLQDLREMAKELGLPRRRVKKLRRWTREEDGRLTTLVEHRTWHQAARELGRSVSSVRVRASRLGLSWGVPQEWYSVRDVVEMLGADDRWVLRRIRNGKLRACSPYGQRPTARAGRIYRVSEQAIGDYLAKHPHEVKGRTVNKSRIAGILARRHPGSAGREGKRERKY